MLKRVFLLFLFLSVNHVFSQNCGLKSYKKKRIAKKIIKLIQNKDYNEAKVVISSLKEHPVFISFKSEIFWLEGDNKNAKKYANEVLYQCEDQFPVLYYVLSEISFQEKDFVSSSFVRPLLLWGISHKRRTAFDFSTWAHNREACPGPRTGSIFHYPS